MNPIRLAPAVTILSLMSACAPGPRELNIEPLLSESTLQGRTLAEWRHAIQPSREELVWESIPWRSSLHEGVRSANAEHKPLLLWMMNGHPLGCT
jgi:hypothetical protein